MKLTNGKKHKTVVTVPSTTTSNYEKAPSKLIGKSVLTRSQAATVIQRTYRAYKKTQLLKKLNAEILKKHRKNQKETKTKRGILSMFREPKNHLIEKENHVSEDTISAIRRNLLEDGSLFHKTRETVLVFGGVDPHNAYGVGKNTAKDVYRYMPLGNCWQFVAELPEPRHHHCTEFYKGRIFLVGGTDPSILLKDSEVSNAVWSFDPVIRRWFKETSMLDVRKNFGLVGCNQGLYAIGGQGSHYQTLDSVERYDVQKNIWERMAPMLTARTGFGYTKYRQQIWVAGGLSERDNTIDILDSVEIYDIKNNQWTELNYPLKFPRCFFSMFVLSDKLYIIGGAGKSTTNLIENDTCSTGNLDYWNNKTFEWNRMTDLHIPRHGHAVSYIGTQILIVGGVTTIYGRALSNTECFCSQRETWVRGLACLPTPLTGHSIVTLPPASLLAG